MAPDGGKWASPVHWQAVADAAKAEYEAITDAATRGAGQTKAIALRAASALKRWKEAEAKAKRTPRPSSKAAQAEAVAQGEVVVSYSRDAGILVCGATRANKDRIKGARYPFRFRYSRNLPGDCAWYVQRTRDKMFTRVQIEAAAKALREAGIANVRVEYEEPGAPDIAAREEKQAERREERAERLDERLAAKELKSKQAWASAQAAGDRLPWGGEPIKVGHHSEGRHRRDIERAHGAMRKSIEAEGSVARASDRVDAAERREAQRVRPGVMRRRMAKFETEIRALERHQSRIANKPLAGRIAELQAEVDYLAAQIAELGVPEFGPDDFAKGQWWILGPYMVTVGRVNPKSVTFKPTEFVPTDMRPFDIWKVPYVKMTPRGKDSRGDHSVKFIASAEGVARGLKAELPNYKTRTEALQRVLTNFGKDPHRYPEIPGPKAKAPKAASKKKATAPQGDQYPSEAPMGLAEVVPDSAIPSLWRAYEALTPSQRGRVDTYAAYKADELEGPWPVWEDFVAYQNLIHPLLGTSGRPVSREREAKHKASLGRLPRIEIDTPDSSKKQKIRYRLIDKHGSIGPIEVGPARGKLTKIEYAEKLGRATGDIPVFEVLGSDSRYDPNPPALSLKPTGFYVRTTSIQHPEGAYIAEPRGLKTAQEIATAKARGWGRVVEIYERRRKIRGKLVSTISYTPATMTEAALAKLHGEIEQGLKAIDVKVARAKRNDEGAEEWEEHREDKAKWARKVKKALDRKRMAQKKKPSEYGRAAQKAAAKAAGKDVCPDDLWALTGLLELQADPTPTGQADFGWDEEGEEPTYPTPYKDDPERKKARRRAISRRFGPVLKKVMKADKAGKAALKSKPGTSRDEKLAKFRKAESDYKDEIEVWLTDWGYEDPEEQEDPGFDTVEIWQDNYDLIDHCARDLGAGGARKRAKAMAEFEKMRAVSPKRLAARLADKAGARTKTLWPPRTASARGTAKKGPPKPKGRSTTAHGMPWTFDQRTEYDRWSSGPWLISELDGEFELEFSPPNHPTVDPGLVMPPAGFKSRTYLTFLNAAEKAASYKAKPQAPRTHADTMAAALRPRAKPKPAPTPKPTGLSANQVANANKSAIKQMVLQGTPLVASHWQLEDEGREISWDTHTRGNSSVVAFTYYPDTRTLFARQMMEEVRGADWQVGNLNTTARLLAAISKILNDSKDWLRPPKVKAKTATTEARSTGLEVRKDGRQWWLWRTLDKWPHERLVRKFATKRGATTAMAILSGDTSQATVTALVKDEAKRAKKLGIRDPAGHAWQDMGLLLSNSGIAAPKWWPRRGEAPPKLGQEAPVSKSKRKAKRKQSSEYGRAAQKKAAKAAGVAICPDDLWGAHSILELQEEPSEKGQADFDWIDGDPPAYDPGSHDAEEAHRRAISRRFGPVLKKVIAADKAGKAALKSKPGTKSRDDKLEKARNAEDNYKLAIGGWLSDWGYWDPYEGDADDHPTHYDTYREAYKLIDQCARDLGAGGARKRAKAMAEFEKMRAMPRKRLAARPAAKTPKAAKGRAPVPAAIPLNTVVRERGKRRRYIVVNANPPRFEAVALSGGDRGSSVSQGDIREWEILDESPVWTGLEANDRYVQYGSRMLRLGHGPEAINVKDASIDRSRLVAKPAPVKRSPPPSADKLEAAQRKAYAEAQAKKASAPSVRELEAAADRGEVIAITGPDSLMDAIERESGGRKPKGKPGPTAPQRRRTRARLRRSADKYEADGKEILGADRKMDTSRRLRMAMSARSQGDYKLFMAKILRRVADQVEKGAPTAIGNVTTIKQLEDLNSHLSVAQANRFRKQNISFTDENRDLPLGIEDVPFAEYRGAWIRNLENIQEVIKAAKGVKGAAQGRRELMRWFDRAEAMRLRANDNWRGLALDKAAVEGFRAVAAAMRKEKVEMPWTGEHVADAIKQIDRMAKLGITDTKTLRQALTDYIGCCRSSRVPKPVDAHKVREAEILLRKIPGFFPTPRAVVERMVESVHIKPGDKVLEPSAGTGSIAEVIRERHPKAELGVIEINNGLREILTEKGFKSVGADFLNHHFGKTGVYDVIVMNPPFEKNADTHHISRALKLLKPGGRLAAIASGSFPTRTDKATADLRAEILGMGGIIEKLPAGTFKDAGTGVSTVVISVEKRAAKKAPLPKLAPLALDADAILRQGGWGTARRDIRGGMRMTRTDLWAEGPKQSPRGGGYHASALDAPGDKGLTALEDQLLGGLAHSGPITLGNLGRRMYGAHEFTPKQRERLELAALELINSGAITIRERPAQGGAKPYVELWSDMYNLRGGRATMIPHRKGIKSFAGEAGRSGQRERALKVIQRVGSRFGDKKHLARTFYDDAIIRYLAASRAANPKLKAGAILLIGAKGTLQDAVKLDGKAVVIGRWKGWHPADTDSREARTFVLSTLGAQPKPAPVKAQPAKAKAPKKAPKETAKAKAKDKTNAKAKKLGLVDDVAKFLESRGLEMDDTHRSPWRPDVPLWVQWKGKRRSATVCMASPFDVTTPKGRAMVWRSKDGKLRLGLLSEVKSWSSQKMHDSHLAMLAASKARRAAEAKRAKAPKKQAPPKQTAAAIEAKTKTALASVQPAKKTAPKKKAPTRPKVKSAAELERETKKALAELGPPTKAAKAPKKKAPPRAKPKAKAKGPKKSRRGRYAIVQGSPGGKVAPTATNRGQLVSTHRKKSTAMKAAATYVARHQLEQIIETSRPGGNRGMADRLGSEVMVFHDETNLVATVRLRVPDITRRKIVRDGTIFGDSYEAVELGLTKLCNVDLGARIKAAKAEKRAKVKKGTPATRRKSSLTEKERAANTRRLIARMAAGDVRI